MTGDDGSPCGVIAQMMGEGIVAVPIKGCKAANIGCNMLEIRSVPGDNEVTIDENQFSPSSSKPRANSFLSSVAHTFVITADLGKGRHIFRRVQVYASSVVVAHNDFLSPSYVPRANKENSNFFVVSHLSGKDRSEATRDTCCCTYDLQLTYV